MVTTDENIIMNAGKGQWQISITNCKTLQGLIKGSSLFIVWQEPAMRMLAAFFREINHDIYTNHVPFRVYCIPINHYWPCSLGGRGFIPSCPYHSDPLQFSALCMQKRVDSTFLALFSESVTLHCDALGWLHMPLKWQLSTLAQAPCKRTHSFADIKTLY